MIRFGSAAVLAFVMVTTVVTGAQAETSARAEARAQVDTPDARRKQVEQLLQPAIIRSAETGFKIQDRLQAHDAPGITVAVIEDFRLDWTKAYGRADTTTGRRLTTQTRHNVGSVSKTVCALTAMRLVEAGKLALDEPINRYLKSWKLPENEFTQDNPVTLRRLLSHSAGTTVHGFPGYRPDAKLPSIQQVLEGEDPANTDPIRVNRAPGEGYRYSGGGTTVVQLAIMDVTGKSFEDAAREWVLEPLGMKHTTYRQPVDGIDLGERAVGYADNPSFKGTEVFVAQGAAGLWSTPTDLARLMIEIMKAYRGDEGTIISQSTAQEMLTRVSGDAGLGFFLEDHNGVMSFGHGGDNTGFHAYVMGLPETGQGIVTIVNSDAGDELQQEVARAVDTVYGWPEDTWDAEVIATGKLDRKTARAISGRYQLGANDVMTIARVGAGMTYRECYWGTRVTELLPLANGHFQLVSANNSLGSRAELVFETNAAGDVNAVRRVGTEVVMPRLDRDTVRPLEHIEAGDVHRAIAGWDQQSDLDAGLMRFTAQRFGLHLKDQLEPGMALRTYVAKRFPLDREAQEMLAEAYTVTGDEAKAQKIKSRYEVRAKALAGVSAQFEAGQVQEGLEALDRLAADIGTPDTYRWLFGIAEGMLADSPRHAMLVARRAAKQLPKSATAQATLARALWASDDAPRAIETMHRALTMNPVAEQAVIERMWVHGRWQGEAVTLSKTEMAQYVGDYGPRHVIVSEGQLAYFRGSNPPRTLIPLGNHQFMMRDLDYFKLEFLMDAKGHPDRIVGHYSSGRRDESPRDSSGDKK